MPYTSEMGRHFWYEFDRSTKYNDSFMEVVNRAKAGRIQTVFNSTRVKKEYPDRFREFVLPVRPDWEILAASQTDAIRLNLGGDWSNVQLAFEDFGQGVLNDADPERAANNDSIHTMDISGTDPPVGYHRWHASIRAIQLLSIGDVAWWEKLDELLGLAWAIQSFARPKQQMAPNPRITAGDLQELRNTWLGMSPERRDRQFDLTGDVGYHPMPKQPVP
jgi:hypothetical protein